MVAQWETAVTKFTGLIPHLFYGTTFWGRASHSAALHSILYTIVLTLIIETFNQLFNQQEADSVPFWRLGVFHPVIFDEPHLWRMHGTPIRMVENNNGMLVKIHTPDYDMYKASCTLSQEVQLKWMIIVTPLLNGIKELHWILHILESFSCLIH